MRLYRWLLRRCSQSLQHQFGAAMEETFARRLADARRIGRLRRARVWLHEVVGLLALVLASASHEAGPMDGIWQEFRHAARRLRRSPAFTLASVLTLTLALAANTAIFALVHRIVLNPLPYPESDRLIVIEHGSKALNAASGLEMTPGLYFHYSSRARALESLAIYQRQPVTLTGEGRPERLTSAHVTPSLQRVLRVRPAVGRWFEDRDVAPGAARVAILSERLWERRYRRDPAVLGRSVVLSGEPVEIVGVMPRSVAFPDPDVDVWMALQISREEGFGLWTYSGVARLAEGVDLADVGVEIDSLIADVAQAYPNDPRARANVQTQLFFAGQSLRSWSVGNVERALWVLMAAVGVVLLIACSNVANLFLVRSEARQREVAVRRALGAGVGRLARYFLTESLLLAALAGVLGVAIAAWAVRAVVSFGPPNLPRLHELRIDASIVGFAAAITGLATLVLAAIPWWRGAMRRTALSESSRGNTAPPGRQRTRQVLMGAQVALALVLLVAAALMARSFQNLRDTDPGFDPAAALTFSIALPPREYATRDAAVAVHHALLDRLASLPGASAVSASSCLPLHAACYANTVRVFGRAYGPDDPPRIAALRAVAGGYFEAMGIRVLHGRSITRADVDHRERVAVVSETLVKRFFPDEEPIGQRIASNRPPPVPGAPAPLEWLTIVGIVADTSTGRVLPGGPPLPQVYMPMSIAGGPGIAAATLPGPDVSSMSVVVRGPVDLEAVRQVVRQLDPNLAIAQTRTLRDILDRASARMAFTMTLLVCAAIMALLLGVIGIYGVMSYSVSQRTGEIGVRLALGAAPASVAGQIIRQGMAVTSIGIVIGLAAAFAGGRFIASLLYGITSRDPAVVAAMTLLLLAVALLACWIPARRAAHLSPIEALKVE